MRPEELQINDWVALRYEKNGKAVDTHVQIDAIIADSSQCVFSPTIWGRGRGTLGNGDNLYPIPITKEMLLNNGFRYERDYGQYYHSVLGELGDIGSHQYVRIGWTPLGDIYQYEVHNCEGVKVSSLEPSRTVYGNCSLHLHELQHALRLCGLNKIADGWKL